MGWNVTIPLTMVCPSLFHTMRSSGAMSRIFDFQFRLENAIFAFQFVVTSSSRSTLWTPLDHCGNFSNSVQWL